MSPAKMSYQPPAASIPRPASHPRSCPTCHGDGWQAGPPRPDTGNPTCTPCTRHWIDDDPDRTDTLLYADHPQARAALARGLAAALAEQSTPP